MFHKQIRSYVVTCKHLSVLDSTLTWAINNELVHATRSKRCADSINNRLASIYVANKLWLALWCVRSFLQQDDWCLLHITKHKHNINKIKNGNKQVKTPGINKVCQRYRQMPACLLCLHNLWPVPLYNFRSGSWLAGANGITAHNVATGQPLSVLMNNRLDPCFIA